MIKSKLTPILKTFLNSKYYIIFQSLIFLTIFFTILYTCLKFGNKKTSIQFILELAITIFINIDIGIRGFIV